MIVDAKIYNSLESLGLGYGRVACDSLFWLSAKTEDTCLQRMFTALSFLRILICRASYATHPFVRRPPSASGRLSLDPSRRSRMLESASNRNVANSQCCEFSGELFEARRDIFSGELVEARRGIRLRKFDKYSTLVAHHGNDATRLYTGRETIAYVIR
jgi:hypothetical protein